MLFNRNFDGYVMSEGAFAQAEYNRENYQCLLLVH